MKLPKPKNIKWFAERVREIIYPTRTECQCEDCVNGYINGILITNPINAENLHSQEESYTSKEYPIIFFDTWQERNAWESSYHQELPSVIVHNINTLNDLLLNGDLEKKHDENTAEEYSPGPNKNHSPAKRMPARRKEKKVGRNEKCPCGSGKKHKRCCGKNDKPLEFKLT